jgi:hypothetical protein
VTQKFWRTKFFARWTSGTSWQTYMPWNKTTQDSPLSDWARQFAYMSVEACSTAESLVLPEGPTARKWQMQVKGEKKSWIENVNLPG